jgi:hypothetical protein
MQVVKGLWRSLFRISRAWVSIGSMMRVPHVA